MNFAHFDPIICTGTLRLIDRRPNLYPANATENVGAIHAEKGVKMPYVNSQSRLGKFLPLAALMGALVSPYAAAISQELAPGVDADGTVHVRELTIAPSEYWSSEFKKYNADSTARLSARPQFPTPAKNASKAEWAKFYAWVDQEYHTKQLERLLETYPVNVVDTKLGGIRVGIITPKQGVAAENEHRVLIHVHGGGFVYNPGLEGAQLESIPVASIGGFKIVTIDYRQAPFHRYPAASEDVGAVYTALLKEYKPEAIGIFGCSAGGALSAQSIAWIAAKKLPRPGAVGIFCAPLPSGSLPLFGRGVGDSGIWTSSPVPKSPLTAADLKAREPVTWYMEGASTNDTSAYPGSSDEVLAKFPATLFLSGTRDAWMSGAVAGHARLLKLGVDSSLYIMEGGAHGVHMTGGGTPEAHDANAYIARWFGQHLAK